MGGKYTQVEQAVNSNNRRAKMRGFPNTLTYDQWQNALNYFNGCCAVCDRQLNDMFGEFKAHLDHWIPLSYPYQSNPGTDVSNAIPLCSKCNSSKSSILPTIWLNRRFGKRRGQKILNKIHKYFLEVSNTINIPGEYDHQLRIKLDKITSRKKILTTTKRTPNHTLYSRSTITRDGFLNFRQRRLPPSAYIRCSTCGVRFLPDTPTQRYCEYHEAKYNQKY